MKEVKAPKKPDYPFRIFLAGSIEMGKAVDWQKQLIHDLCATKNIVILNPRRDDWDSSWEQSIANKKFREQVEWELKMLRACDLIALYFAPDTKSPISLLELGLFADSRKIVVCCPDGFWRKGNVEIVCQQYGIPLFSKYSEWRGEIKKRIQLS